MTRQAQNDVIINSLQDQLRDKPRAQELISNAFKNWFSALVASALRQMQAQEAQKAQQPEETPQ